MKHVFLAGQTWYYARASQSLGKQRRGLLRARKKGEVCQNLKRSKFEAGAVKGRQSE
ncbi:hypothetical protein CY34DRAFT_799502 [Suillus luteus UH-Slu-Lm8-n1]|uniref:Uncharacterized protein n=1 Tax=Suillus luteus UH-Slu-Lm8-n1 TaxID=930992 RepID=A0A0D0BNE6_9AGAM|nr:hypothetical protein CY34DRAFT_799502 [Suillus luteus UH-Slu-Lm8-n1]